MKIDLHLKPSVFSAVFFLCILLGLQGPAYGYILIDSFTSFDSLAVATGYNASDSNAWVVSSTGWSIKPAAANSPVTVFETGLSDVLGGTRLTSAQWSSTTGDSTALYTGSYAGSTGFLFLNTGAGNQYGSISTSYSAGGVGLNADFSNEDSVRVVFDPDHLAFGKDSVMRMTLSDSNSNYALERRWDNPDDYVSQPGVLEIDFQLSLFAANGIDLSKVKNVTFFYEGDHSNDVAFNSIATVPIPAAVWLLGSGLVGLGGLRRRFGRS